MKHVYIGLLRSALVTIALLTTSCSDASSGCSKEETLKLVDAGYTKDEIGSMCNQKESQSRSQAAAPSIDKIKADLIGIKACNWHFDSISEFREIKILDQTTSSEIVEYDLDIEVEDLKDSRNDHFITARVIYKKLLGEWVIRNFNEKTCSSTKLRERYGDHGDGTLTDKQTGLMWKQCVEGVSGTGCSSGKVISLTWQDAINHGEHAEIAGYSDWRLPSIEELLTIVDKRYKDEINPFVFPNTPVSSFFWSNSPDANHNGVGPFRSSGLAQYYNFGRGEPASTFRSNKGNLRLVRSGIKD